MPIQEIAKSSGGPVITKACQVCKNVEEIKADTLKLGNAAMPEVIDLPPCSKCAAAEMLVRSVDASAPDRMSAHRKSVNALANYLQASGKVDASAVAFYADQDAKGIKAAPVGELYGRVQSAPAPSAKAPVANPAAMAQQALAMAQQALDAINNGHTAKSK